MTYLYHMFYIWKMKMKMNNVAERFYHHYEAKGWKIGKEQMKNWKSCVITWKEGNLKTATATQPTQKRFNIADYE